MKCYVTREWLMLIPWRIQVDKCLNGYNKWQIALNVFNYTESKYYEKI
jgi:hypothetical protein